MACYSLQIAKVWKDETGVIYIDTRNSAVPANPELCVPKYTRGITGSLYDDEVSLIVSGTPYWGFQSFKPDAIRKQDGSYLYGNAKQTIDDVKAYFTELGIGQPSGGTGGITPEQLNTILEGYVTKEEYDTQISFILSQLGITKLDTPALTSDTPTSNSVNITIGSVVNGQVYELFRNGVSVYTGAAGTVPQTGLASNTEYTYTAQVTADGYAPSDLATLLVTTQQGQQTQLATPQPVASNVTANSLTISWPAIPNATIYEVRRNNIPQTGVIGTTFNDSGLTPSTQYQYIVIAKAQGYIDSAQGIVSATTQSGQQPGNTNIFPLTFPFQFAS